MSASKSTGFLHQFRDPKTNKFKNFTATQFADVWSHFDTDGNGFIEGHELDDFLKEFIVSVAGDKIGELNATTIEEMKRDFLAAVDENSDNKIEISELAQFLPTDENFLLLFRRHNPLDSSVDFMKLWKQFDKDQSGFIEADELKSFLTMLVKETRPNEPLSEEKLLEYTSTMLQLFDANKDGKLALSEMARLLPVKENYLSKPIFKNADKISPEDIERVFNIYDKDKNGTIENEELQGFLKDLLSMVHENYNKEDLDFFRNIILNEWDVDHDGKIDKNELKMMLLQQSRLSKLQHFERKH